MSKKITCLLLVVLILLTTASAFADSLKKTHYAIHYEYYYDGTQKQFEKVVGTATYTYGLNTDGTIYTGGKNLKDVSIAKSGTCTSASINAQPSFGANTTNEGKGIIVTYSGGKVTFVFKPSVNVAADGTRSAPFNKDTKSSTLSASKTHKKD